MDRSSTNKSTSYSSPVSPQEESAFFCRFFRPLLDKLNTASNSRICPVLPDLDWLRLGVRRCLEIHSSGRAFLQSLFSQGIKAPDNAHFFATLASSRRLAIVKEVSKGVARSMPNLIDERWNDIPGIEAFDLYAGDGHFHAAACHDKRGGSDNSKVAVGHFYTLNLKTHALDHLVVADQVNRRKEHDMRALKGLDREILRQGAPKGRKVLYVWDRAGIDFRYWERMKKTAGIYFVSREKANMKLETIALRAWGAIDKINHGVLSDELMATSQGVSVRRVKYYCAVQDLEFSFITSDLTLAPGVIAHLYRVRWEIEKTFDELKNKLEEQKAWASSPEAKTMQAHFLCLTHNLMVMCEQSLEVEHNIRNEAEIKRRRERLKKDVDRLNRVGKNVPWLTIRLQQLTVRSVKFIRWLRVQLFKRGHHPPAIEILRQLYAVL